MSEQLDLAVPIVPPTQTSYRLVLLSLDWNSQAIRIVVQASDGEQVPASYNGATAVSLMTTLNSANLTTSSLQKRVLLKLTADGILPAGTVNGTAA
jgi:hypothetical protein